MMIARASVFGLALMVLTLGAASLPAQDQPKFVLNTDAPSNTVQAVAFSPDSTRLYAAGMDKAVFAWELSEGLLIKGLKANPVQTLRWEVSRGHRGAIFSMSAPLQGRDLALGGISARDGNGNIIIYDTAAARVRTVLHARNPQKNYQGHANAVVGVAWSPDGSRLASTSIDGELRLWTVQNQQSILLRPAAARPGVDPETKNDQWFPVAFLNNDVLIGATRLTADGAKWGLTLYNLAQPVPLALPLSQVHEHGVFAIVRDPQSDRWLSADGYGRVFLWQGPAVAQQPQLLRFEPKNAVSAASFAGDGLVALLTWPIEGNAAIELRRIGEAAPLDKVYFRRVEDNIGCLAISPNLRWLATSGEDEGPVVVYELRDPAGKPVTKPLSAGNPTLIRARGRDIGKVAFAVDGYRIGFGTALRADFITKDGQIRNHYGDIDRAFDLNQGALTPDKPDPKRWLVPHSFAGPWGITAVPGQPWRLQLWNGPKPASTITLNRDRQGRIVSYCWLGQRGGKPPQIAIGTDHQNGVFIYEVRPSGECPLLRYYRDHTGLVASLSMSTDGKYLASGSADHTIKIWSLEGLHEEQPFARAKGWGAVIQKLPLAGGAKVTITSVLPQGIAARRGLRSGDEIIKVETAAGAYTRPDDMLRALVDLPLWETTRLSIARGADKFEDDNGFLLVPAWEPLATLYVDEADEWVLATPQGFYEASPAGDELVGWQINKGVDQTPEFVAAEQFRAKLHKREVLRELFRVGMLQSAVDKFLGLDANRLQGYLYNLAASGVRVAVHKPTDAHQFKPGQLVEAEAVITYPQQRTARDYQVRAYVNGTPYSPVASEDLPESRQRVRFNITGPDSLNALTIKVEEKGIAAPQFDAEEVHFRADAAPAEKSTLHILTLAAGKYAQPTQDLHFTVSDAENIQKTLIAAAKDLYETRLWGPLKEDAISAQSLRGLADQMKREITNPRDLLVVFVAGHGEIVDNEYYFVPGGIDLADRKAVQQQGIKWEQIAAFAEAPCRRLFLLETCNSGNVTTLEEARPMLQSLNKEKAMVLTAAGVNEKAYGYDGKGAFTRLSLAALQGDADGNGDGRIVAAELASYVMTRVPPTVSSYGPQHPKVYPLNVAEFERVPVSRRQLAAPVAGN